MADTETPDPKTNRFSVNTAQESTLTTPPQPTPLTRLTDADHIYLIRSLAGSTSPDPEHATVIHPSSSIYPPRGLPPSLYRSVVLSRTIANYQYLISSLLFNISLILQLILGAALTALGSSTDPKITNIPITVLAAANTINAGVLALMHNSGLPDRFKKDSDEFEKVELSIREVLETGVVIGKDAAVEQVVEGLWESYREAVATVAKNKPSSYVGSAGVGKKDKD